MAQVLDLGSLSIQAGFENRIHDQVGIRVRRNGANLDAHALLVADRDTDHGATVDRRCLDLVGRLEVRIETAVSVDAGVQHQANVVPVREDAIEKRPTCLAQFLLALGIPKEILAVTH